MATGDVYHLLPLSIFGHRSTTWNDASSAGEMSRSRPLIIPYVLALQSFAQASSDKNGISVRPVLGDEHQMTELPADTGAYRYVRVSGDGRPSPTPPADPASYAAPAHGIRATRAGSRPPEGSMTA